jgi:hypothetical protein
MKTKFHRNSWTELEWQQFVRGSGIALLNAIQDPGDLGHDVIIERIVGEARLDKEPDVRWVCSEVPDPPMISTGLNAFAGRPLQPHRSGPLQKYRHWEQSPDQSRS